MTRVKQYRNTVAPTQRQPGRRASHTDGAPTGQDLTSVLELETLDYYRRLSYPDVCKDHYKLALRSVLELYEPEEVDRFRAALAIDQKLMRQDGAILFLYSTACGFMAATSLTAGGVFMDPSRVGTVAVMALFAGAAIASSGVALWFKKSAEDLQQLYLNRPPLRIARDHVAKMVKGQSLYTLKTEAADRFIASFATKRGSWDKLAAPDLEKYLASVDVLAAARTATVEDLCGAIAIAVRLGDAAKAQSYYVRLREKGVPDEKTTCEVAVVLQDDLRRRDLAIAWLEGAPFDTSVREALASLYFSAKAFDKALSVLEELHDRDRSSQHCRDQIATVWKMKALHAWDKRRFSDAVNAFDNAWRIAPNDDIGAYLVLARFAVKAFDGARDLLPRLDIKGIPDDLLVHIADVAKSLGHDDTGAACMQRRRELLESSPFDAGAWRQLALGATDDAELAHCAWSKLENDPCYDLEAHSKLADLEEAAQNFVEALRHLSWLVEGRRDNDAKILMRRGRVLKRLGRFKQAARDFELANRIAPQAAKRKELAASRTAYADAIVRSRPDRAIDILKSVLAHEETAATLVRLGKAHEFIGGYKHALEYFDRATQLDTNDRSAWTGAASTRVKLLEQDSTATADDRRRLQEMAATLAADSSSLSELRQLVAKLRNARVRSAQHLQDLASRAESPTVHNASLTPASSTDDDSLGSRELSDFTDGLPHTPSRSRLSPPADEASTETSPPASPRRFATEPVGGAKPVPSKPPRVDVATPRWPVVFMAPSAVDPANPYRYSEKEYTGHLVGPTHHGLWWVEDDGGGLHWVETAKLSADTLQEFGVAAAARAAAALAQCPRRQASDKERQLIMTLLAKPCRRGVSGQDIVTQLSGLGHKAYVVGGAVRDALRLCAPGRAAPDELPEGTDVDLVSTTTSDVTKRVVDDLLGPGWQPRDTRSLAMAKAAAAHGSILVLSDEAGAVPGIEITSMRAAKFYDARVTLTSEPEMDVATRRQLVSPAVYGEDIIADARSRDFCLNALYYDVETNEIIDPTRLGIDHAITSQLEFASSDYIEKNERLSLTFEKLIRRDCTASPVVRAAVARNRELFKHVVERALEGLEH